MRKHLIAGAAILALFVNSPQVSAADEDVVIFGGEFDDDTKPREVERPAPVREVPPPVDKPVAEPVKQPEPPPVEKPKPEPVNEPKVEPVAEPEPVKQPVREAEPVKQPVREAEPVKQPVNEPKFEPAQNSDEDDDDLGDVLIFDDISHAKVQPVDEPKPAPVNEPVTEPVDEPFKNQQPEPVNKPVDEPVKIEPPPVEKPKPSQRTQVEEPSNTKLKQLKKRFVKLAVDETYIYYLDRTSVQWRKMPYSSSEYIADFWVRMIAREPQNDEDSYGADDDSLEILSAREKGYRYRPEDEEVLRRQSYVLEHYYLRPKTQQIQFLCELEVFGRPQNTINEREYDYRNWENLVPGSVESVIYTSVIKLIDTSKADAKGHMTFSDMLDEYLRISL